MKMLQKQAARLAMAAAAAVAGTVHAAPADLPPIENFTRLPDMKQVSVSPSGKRLAAIMGTAGGNLRLAVLDLDPLGAPRIVAQFSDADVHRAEWIGEDRLVFKMWQRRAWLDRGGAGTIAVNHDGSGWRPLIAWADTMPGKLTGSTSKTLPYNWFVTGPLHDSEGNGVAVGQVLRHQRGDVLAVNLARMNTVTGELRNLSIGMPSNTVSWLLDANNEPAVATTAKDGRTGMHWHNPQSRQWEKVAEFERFTTDALQPQRIDESGRIFVLSHDGGDVDALHIFDPVKRGIDPLPVVKVKGFDLDPFFVEDYQTRHLLGIYFTADRPMTYWFDPAMQRLQRGVDAALPADRSNTLLCGNCESTRFVVVLSSSDRQPGEYFLFDRSKGSLARIGSSRPWIDETTQGHRSFHRVTARDGLSIPLYVTRPAGAPKDKPLPAVMLVHGGPWVRGSDLGWDAEAQFFASRGYVVLQPEFRGSTGYGDKLFRAGMKQWGRAMQDDLVDTIQWAAGQQWVDPQRVCIVGGSYGGYAALMGPIAHPGAYRCAASYAGVTDINLMYDITWSDAGDAYREFGMPVLIGDRVKDEAALAAASPLKRVAEIKVPLLLGHGTEDARVPLAHFNKFKSAAIDAGVKLESVVYVDEGHGLFEPADEIDWYRRLERFLAASLQPAP